jgi:hypothetical protein
MSQRNAIKTVKMDSIPESPLTQRVKNSELDAVTYYDPEGRIGEEKNELPEMHEQVKEHQKKLADALEDVGSGEAFSVAMKAMDTSRISVPTFTSPEVRIGDEEQLPIVSTSPRVAVSEQVRRHDEVVNIKGVDTASEGGDLAEFDDDIVTHEYEIDTAYGRESTVTDLVKLSAEDKAPSQTEEELNAEAIRRFEESYALDGTQANVNFEGVRDFATAQGLVENNATKGIIARVRDAITYLESVGVSTSDGMIVMNHALYRDLKDALEDRQRFRQVEEETDLGIRQLTLDGFTIRRSNQASADTIYGFDASVNRFEMLEDLSMKPQPASGLQDKFLNYVYGEYVSVEQTKNYLSEPTN